MFISVIRIRLNVDHNPESIIRYTGMDHHEDNTMDSDLDPHYGLCGS